MSTRYLLAVQDDNGRELVSGYAEVAKVGDISATVDEHGKVIIRDGETVIAEGGEADQDTVLTLHRWEAEDKLGKPVSKKVSR